MAWELLYDPKAEKELSKLDKAVQRDVHKYLVGVCKLQDPADRGHPLTGPYAGLHRYRVGQLRIIASIERNIITITVIAIGRRDSIY